MKAKVISKNKVVYRSNLEAIYGGLFEEAGIDFVFGVLGTSPPNVTLIATTHS